MDSDSGKSDTNVSLETVFEAAALESSEEPPIDEWSSLDLKFDETNPKKQLHDEGLYDPGSGQICTKYIAMSASSVLKHVYFKYPAIEDPGILKALLKPEEQVIYPDDGQKLYLALCEESNLCVVRIFYKGLVQSEIDLNYYGVNSNGVRVMAAALKYNKYVKIINYSNNFLSVDACYHLGDMLASNNYLVELNLSGCRIGPGGLKRLLNTMVSNRSLITLNLSKNEVGDEGMEFLADAVMKGLDVKKINLSYNSISGKGLRALVEPFETYNKFTHWNLSWNNLYSPGTYNFLTSISESTKNVSIMDLSWNSLAGPRIGQGIRNLMAVRDLVHLNLSNNQLEGEAIEHICTNLLKAKKLKSLNLSYNPMSPRDCILILQKLKLRTVKVSQIYLDNITVNAKFLAVLNEVKTIKPEVIVTHGNVIGTFQPVGPDNRELVLNRIEYLCKKPKKKVDIALIVLQLHKDNVSSIVCKDFYNLVSGAGAPVDNDLVDEIANVFPAPRTGKEDKSIGIPALVEYITRKWPDRKLPPTPPPEPEPEPEPEPIPVPETKEKKKGKGKK